MARFDRVASISWDARRRAGGTAGGANPCAAAGTRRRGAAAPGNAPPPIVRTDISGDWAVVSNEDQPHRVPGPELGDYTGLPLNDADRQKADAWDASILSQPERQAQAHPVQYLMRGPGPALRILKILDPVTQELVAYTIAGGFGRADRVVWMDGRPHPSDFSEHTWDGFSTGVWEQRSAGRDDDAHETGRHPAQRIGDEPVRQDGRALLPARRHHDDGLERRRSDLSRRADGALAHVAVEHQREHGASATRSNRSTSSATSRSVGCRSIRSASRIRSLREKVGLPFGATRGGKESLYPEYQLKIQEMVKQEAARKAAEAAKKDAADKKPAKK